jgi:hypothetical protein
LDVLTDDEVETLVVELELDVPPVFSTKVTIERAGALPETAPPETETPVSVLMLLTALDM